MHVDTQTDGQPENNAICPIYWEGRGIKTMTIQLFRDDQAIFVVNTYLKYFCLKLHYNTNSKSLSMKNVYTTAISRNLMAKKTCLYIVNAIKILLKSCSSILNGIS